MGSCRSPSCPRPRAPADLRGRPGRSLRAWWRFVPDRDQAPRRRRPAGPSGRGRQRHRGRAAQRQGPPADQLSPAPGARRRGRDRAGGRSPGHNGRARRGRDRPREDRRPCDIRASRDRAAGSVGRHGAGCRRLSERPGHGAVERAGARLRKPTTTPPYPAQRGLRGKPTLVANVETLAQVALIARHGACWFRELGSSRDPGSRLVTISGAVARPGVIEIACGTPLPMLLRAAGGVPGRSRGSCWAAMAASGWAPAPANSSSGSGRCASGTPRSGRESCSFSATMAARSPRWHAPRAGWPTRAPDNAGHASTAWARSRRRSRSSVPRVTAAARTAGSSAGAS